MGEPDLLVLFATDTRTVTYVPEDDVIVCPLGMLFEKIDFAAIQLAVAERWRLS